MQHGFRWRHNKDWQIDTEYRLTDRHTAYSDRYTCRIDWQIDMQRRQTMLLHWNMMCQAFLSILITCTLYRLFRIPTKLLYMYSCSLAKYILFTYRPIGISIQLLHILADYIFVYISSHGGCLQMYCLLSLMITLSFSWVHFGYNTCLQSCYKLITMITFYYITGLWGCLQTGCPCRRSWQSSLPLRHHQQHRSACDPQTGQCFWGQLKGKWRSLFKGWIT